MDDTVHDDEHGSPTEEELELDRRTVRKIDIILLPFLMALFLFNSLDKSNVSVISSGKPFPCGAPPVCSSCLGDFVLNFITSAPKLDFGGLLQRTRSPRSRC